ncbi:signal peptidase I [Actinoplanes sp. TFC3]|uniref:signal peptidase I n=1 Tax=Actinoplanes sp. TFC3 TaxID=1710355 RepID=UPI00082F338F|nr:signal peptidase I [Actinoplanes sp. TFC3]
MNRFDRMIAAARVAACAVLAFVAATALWSLAPLAAGLRSDVVMSGSMAPALRPGDVVVAVPVDARTLRPGQIIVFRDPAAAGRLVVHRFIRYAPSGALITKGDANTAEDGTPVPRSAVAGLARVRIPGAGLARYWFVTSHTGYLAVAALALLGLVVVATRPGVAVRPA